MLYDKNATAEKYWNQMVIRRKRWSKVGSRTPIQDLNLKKSGQKRELPFRTIALVVVNGIFGTQAKICVKRKWLGEKMASLSYLIL